MAAASAEVVISVSCTSEVPTTCDRSTSCNISERDIISQSKSEANDTKNNDRMKPSSYLIFDTETTGLPGPYGNPRITELCLLGVHRDDMFEDGVGVPRVVNKLQLCLNPQKRVTPGSSMITGLFNDALERQQPFNQNTITIIRGFIQAQAQPTCLIAHNGDNFDFPLLVSELMKTEEELPQNVLCADSLLAFRELDADPEGPAAPLEVKGHQTWDKTEVTPVKRAGPDEVNEVNILPKKPRKDLPSESLSEDIERHKVAKKLKYEFSSGKGDDAETYDTTPSSSELGSNAAKEHIVKDTVIGQTVDILSVHCNNQEKPRKCPTATTISPCSQGSLLDDEFLKAVTQLETKTILSVKQQDDQLSESPSSSTQILTRDDHDAEPLMDSNEAVNCSAGPLISTAEPVTSTAESLTRAGVPIITGTTNIEYDDCTVSLSEIQSKTVECNSVDKDAHPLLTSESTIIYNYEASRPTEQTTSKDLNSQASLTDSDFLAAVQDMEMEQENAVGCVENSGKGVDIAETSHTGGLEVMDIDAKNSNFCQTRKSGVPNSKCQSTTENNKSNVQNKNLTGFNGVSEKDNTPSEEAETPNGSTRRSFRLPDIYRRHFGHLPKASHTAEDDCISLLKLIKKFSPRFLEWVDENCVPFRMVQPMY